MRRSAITAAVVFSLALTVGLSAPAQVVAAVAAGPSVPLPETNSVPVTGQSVEARDADAATTNALQGNQQPGGTPAADGAGNPSATPLAASATWNVSGQTGDFSWSYPLRVPPAPGGLEPKLALSYSSSSIDGRTSATNNQPSWVGDGWDLNPGFVERTYGGCADDKEGTTKGQAVGDLCWRSDNATASYAGSGGMLIPGANGWRSKNDDGSRVERLTAPGNGDNDGEYWKITAVDGTQYFFGSRADAKSVWTVPVFGDDDNEPCHQTTFAASSCKQAWRWNLDKIVDRFGNTILLQYQTETNKYGLNFKDTAVEYDRGGWLDRIDYGLHSDGTGQASARVLFGTEQRCVPGSVCTLDRKENFPDVPLDAGCDTATCKDKYSPTFWSTKRLASVTTQVLRGSSYSDVDKWNLDQQFPKPGDGEKPALWLKSISHTGLAGGAITLPPVTFEGAPFANRVHQADQLSPVLRYRLTGIVSESGGLTSVNYAAPDCLAAPAHPESNTLRCFPARWKKTKDYAERTDYFNKYVVASVAQSDRLGTNPQQVTSYEYLGGAAWHYSQSEFTPPDKKTWDDFRGFAKVKIRTGTSNDPAGPVTMTEQRFFRGMNGDRATPTGGTKPAAIEDSEGGSYPDHDWLQGVGLETITYLGDTTSVVRKSITEPVWQGPTATRGEHNAYLIGVGTTRDLVALDGGRGWRTTKTVTSYDDHGLPTKVDDLGNVADPADDTCTTTSYVRNTTAWLLNLPSRVEQVAVNCATTPVFPQHAISDVRTSYDEQNPGTAPVRGAVTRTEELAERPAAGPEYTTTSTARYDQHGRVIESGNALGKLTTTTYTPATGGPVTKTVVKNPLGHTSSVAVDPAFGNPLTSTDANNRVTESTYDALGRVTAVWQPNRPRGGSSPQSANATYAYQVRNDQPSVVTANTIGPNGRYVSVNTIYDGLLRPRQIQAPAAGGGRLLTDTRYDSQGRVWKATQPFFNATEVDGNLWVANDNEVPGLTTTQYDGAGRLVESIFSGGPTEKFRTSTRYGGDRVSVDPPDGSPATTKIDDARGRAIEFRQYYGSTPTGSSDATRYEYTPAGQLAALIDAAGNRWENTYDLRGRKVKANDPDRGISTATYDAADRVVTQTDARAQTVVSTYDDLDRKTAEYSGSLTGRKLAAWTYDTLPSGLVAKGQPATATRYDADGNAYTSGIDSYTALYLPSRTTMSIPANEGGLAGVYTSKYTYNPDGSLQSETLPAAGDLPGESVFHTYDDAARPLRTYGGTEGSTTEYALNTEYTRYGEQQRVHLGEGSKRTWLSTYYDDNTRQVNRTIVDAELPQPMQSDTRYTRDASGGITSIAESAPGVPDDLQCFRYDHVQRLTEAWTAGAGCTANPAVPALSGPAPYWQSYGYDKAGNRRTDVQHAAGGDTTRTYNYPATGQVRPHAVSSVTTSGPGGNRSTGYGYDAAGNTVTRGAQSLAWTPESRLDKVTEAGADTTSAYAADGSRLIRRESSAAVLYLAGQEIRLDKATGKLTGTRYYEHSGTPIAVRTATGLSWLASDHHGTQRLAISAETQTVARRRELPFGSPRGAAASAFPGEKGFVRGTLDSSTGLTQLGARSYDPDTGRFISVDPLLVVDDPQQLDGYSYAANGPVNGSDPTGLARSDDDNIGTYRDGKWMGSSPPQVTPDGRRIPKASQPSCNKGGDCRAGSRGTVRPPGSQPSCNKGGDCRAGSRGVVTPVPPAPPAAPPSGTFSGWSISWCYSASIQFWFGHSGEGCISLDSHGIGHSEASKNYYGPGAGLGLTMGPKFATTDIPGLEGPDSSVGGEVKIGGVGVGLEGAKSDGPKGNRTDGSWSVGASVGPALGLGGYLKGLEQFGKVAKIQGFLDRYGMGSGALGRGEASSDYYFQWDGWVQRAQQGYQEAARNGTLQDRVHG
ncbi:RHS repeat-associated core domain-containing protein [Kribbella sp. NPDC056861]|uniref:RHS repeat-associated core domain-containing protein n=1 Tax=Kribbella sp. NPDC056861 TaxID=3154857 RepID=UPI0034250D9A